MSSFSDMISALFGGSPSPKTFSADPVTQYPTHEDADFARKQDFSYAQPYAPYFTGDVATALKGSPKATPMQTENLTARQFGNQGQNNDYYARAALATNNSALARLGFDPSHTAADFSRDPKQMNILGTYKSSTDQIYANAQDPSSIVHESIHRGIQKLKESPQWQPEFDDVTKGAMEEAAVRHIMAKKMGDPEAQWDEPGNVNKHQRDWAEAMFTGYPRYQQLLDKMELAASKYMSSKQPMGPR